MNLTKEQTPLEKIRDGHLEPSIIEEELSEACFNLDRLKIIRDAVTSGVRIRIEALQTLASEASNIQSKRAYQDAGEKYKKILKALEEGKPAHIVRDYVNGITIPASIDANTKKGRMGWRNEVINGQIKAGGLEVS